MESIGNNSILFNGPLETGIRVTILLNAAYPNQFDIETLIVLNYLVVHTSVIGGPKSLHPNLPSQVGEILVGREKIETSLKAMCQLGLVELIPEKEGLFYRSTDDAYPFVNSLKSTYTKRLVERAEWVANFMTNQDRHSYDKLVSELRNAWNTEI